MHFSIIIPVYNRPDEIDELLESLVIQDYNTAFEIVIVEDGSTIDCKNIVEKYAEKLIISYFFKPNSGPGDSRNYGMKKAKGDYFIIFDSDCIIPKNYLSEVDLALKENFTDCFGGPDKALDSFSNIQKAINFSMTSFLTTGGIRGGSEKIDKFQPRSFNMGISKKAFESSNGFGNIHPGEDPDLSIRLWKMNFETRLIPSAYVYHKRRIDWTKFHNQVSKFGKARPILNSWYPEFSKPTFFFPTLFMIGFFTAVTVAVLFGFYFPLVMYGFYYLLLFFIASYCNKSVKIGSLSVVASFIQFYGYGFGFLKSFFLIQLMSKNPQEEFPELFFKSIKHD
ncbi:glycosyltransferase [Flavobacterium lacus]|uniref:Cellulose synthase/poly-beta-1,6-N-acetylglucosamine synthase-like glycosyltransferase n=1 Tax=Flavobacterium lacus TaxID=1353778 RepID=A0A328WS74_9FLAO|nr:glycosyltransferase [Flavobacterium lacus]RAR49061.1 cellulose synthase/poly-beta-1,6-N-acetylglucosamine synthase-like glycosyltransferase [Flavobacterium lacus]